MSRKNYLDILYMCKFETVPRLLYSLMIRLVIFLLQGREFGLELPEVFKE